jgi:hypothetical protein
MQDMLVVQCACGFFSFFLLSVRSNTQRMVSIMETTTAANGWAILSSGAAFVIGRQGKNNVGIVDYRYNKQQSLKTCDVRRATCIIGWKLEKKRQKPKAKSQKPSPFAF